jgi:hypothetical protein
MPSHIAMTALPVGREEDSVTRLRHTWRSPASSATAPAPAPAPAAAQPSIHAASPLEMRHAMVCLWLRWGSTWQHTAAPARASEWCEGTESACERRGRAAGWNMMKHIMMLEEQMMMMAMVMAMVMEGGRISSACICRRREHEHRRERGTARLGYSLLPLPLMMMMMMMLMMMKLAMILLARISKPLQLPNQEGACAKKRHLR